MKSIYSNLMRGNLLLCNSIKIHKKLGNSIPKRSIFIDTENTPNPHSIKFLPAKEVLPEAFGTGMDFQRSNTREIMRSPLAKKLFSFDGVKGVFLGRDFISVTKEPEVVWHTLKPLIFSGILDFYAEGKAVLEDLPERSDTAILETDDEVVATIKELIESRVRPSVQDDGGDIFYVDFDSVRGIVKVRLAGSCVGCPSSSVTLRNGVENMLMHYVPEVKGIEEAEPEESDTTAKLEYHPGSV